jgi:hypothetical protein
MHNDLDLLAPGVLEAGLLSISKCPVCSENWLASLHRADILFGTEPWVPKPCPQHPNANWGT